jgi:hypothetical protein
MPSPGLERTAHIIAENVASAIARDPASPLRDRPRAREAVLTAIMVELLRVMPTDDSDRLAAACNRALDELAITGLPRPRVSAVDPDDGSVTMTVT